MARRGSYQPIDWEETRPHLLFRSEDIDLLNRIAALERRTLSRQIEVIVTQWLTEWKATQKAERDEETVRIAQKAMAGVPNL